MPAKWLIGDGEISRMMMGDPTSKMAAAMVGIAMQRVGSVALAGGEVRLAIGERSPRRTKL
jgi:hypothetical protein